MILMNSMSRFIGWIAMKFGTWSSLNFPPNTIIRLQLSFPVKIAAKLTRFLFSLGFFSMLTCSTKIIPAKASFISLQQLGS